MKVKKRGNKLVAVRCENDVNTTDGCGMNSKIAVGDTLGSINIKTGKFTGNTYALVFLEKELGVYKSEKTKEAKEVLKKAGYQVDNLWSILDVLKKFDCTNEEAHILMNKSLTNKATMEQIWLAIEMEGEMMNLKPVKG